MKQTRREFLVTSAVVAGGAALLTPTAAAAGDPIPPHELFEADPYTSHVDENGLGGRSFDDAREHALRFRMTGSERDRRLLGLEI